MNDSGTRDQLILGDCAEMLRTLDPRSVSLVLTDPPYGIAESTDRKARKRTALAECNDFPPIDGDDKPFDPRPLLRFRRLVIFGGNYFAHLLPPSPSWLIWDKLDGLTSKREVGFNDNADAEMAWTNLGGPARILSHRWMGCMKGSERDERRVHPTQKPVSLMRQIIELYTSPGDLVFDPYMGSGSVGIAAVASGRSFIGVEIVPAYYKIASEGIAEAKAALSWGAMLPHSRRSKAQQREMVSLFGNEEEVG